MFKIQVNVDKAGWLDCINMPDLETEEQARQWLKDNEADKLIALVPVVEFRIVPIDEPDPITTFYAHEIAQIGLDECECDTCRQARQILKVQS